MTMSSPETGLRPPELLVRALTEDEPFGNSGYIDAQLQAAYARRLRRLSRVLPIAGDLADALADADKDVRHRTYGDPALRTVIQQALTQVATGVYDGFPLSDCADVFREAVRHVERGESMGPLEANGAAAERLGQGEFHGWIWNEDRPEDAFTRAFRYLIERAFDGPLCSPRPGDVATLRRAAELLEEVSPALAHSALSHAQLIALFPRTGRWENVSSGSQFRVGGVIFLAREKLENPWYVAEHMIHEALHQKLYDIRHAHSVLRRDFDPEAETTNGGTPQVVSLWNPEEEIGSNRWGPSRSLAAFHVYAHLAVYAKLAEVAQTGDGLVGGGPYGDGLTTAASAFRRALYLGDRLRAVYRSELGLAGECLVDWLTQCLELTSQLPTDAELRTALLLERYGREIQRTEAFVADAEVADTDGSAAEWMSQLVAGEIDSTRRALSACKAAGPLEAFDHEVSKYAPQSAGRNARDAAGIRWSIHETLTRIVVDDDSRCESAPLIHEIVVSMVENAINELTGVSLANATDQLPLDARGELLRLTDVIGEVFGTEEFCLFLYAMVRMHAPKVIVELGTGLGASAFWMALAAKRNGVGHVWTVDDLTLSEGYSRILARNRARLAGTAWASLSGTTAIDYMVEIRRVLGLDEHLTFVHQRIDLDDLSHLDEHIPQGPVDLLFSDFSHGPQAILEILGQFLPRMAGASSVFIDGASTAWSSYLLLEHLVGQLNQGTVPAVLQSHSAVDLRAVIENRRILLVHLTEGRSRTQNSTAWLKLEPIDLQPHPVTSVRGLTGADTIPSAPVNVAGAS
jgi:hypothetical protein